MSLVPLILSSALIGGVAVPSLGLEIFRSEGPFLSAAPIVSTETFDEFPNPTVVGARRVEIDEVVYEAIDRDPEFGQESWIAGIKMGAPPFVSPPNDFGASQFGDNVMSFGDDQLVEAFGFWFSSGSGVVRDEYPHWQILVSEVDGRQTVVDILFLIGNEKHYYGLLSQTGIRTITVRDFPGDGRESNWSYDNVSRGAVLDQVVPSVTGWWLALMAVVLVLTGLARLERGLGEAGGSLSLNSNPRGRR